jgi:hypothetical protein
MSRTLGGWLRLVGGAAILGCLFWRLGTGPFLDGLRAVDARSLIAAAAIAVVTTVCAAWRWTIVARGLGVAMPLRTAVAASYRAQFLNTALPGGVLGDVHRGVRHGQAAGDVSRGLRAVAWERTAGQLVQAAVAVAVLWAVPSPVRAAMPVVVLAVIAVVALLALLALTARSGSGLVPRLLRVAGSDLRRGVFARDAWPAVLFASVVVGGGRLRTDGVGGRPARGTAPTLLLHRHDQRNQKR